jgi:hypothetical protein
LLDQLAVQRRVPIAIEMDQIHSEPQVVP